MSTVEIETGRYIKRFAFWNPATWSIPKLYWDAWSQEQRIHAICRQLEKVIAYADYIGVNVDDIAARLKAIEEGQLDEIITAAVEQWFEDHEEEILSDIADLKDRMSDAEEDISSIQGVLESVTSEQELQAIAVQEMKEKFVGKYIGVLSTFRFGYRPPQGFNVANMLAIAQNDYDIFAEYDWTYMPTSDDMRQQIPLFTENPYRPGWQGEHCTCSGLVQDVLYKCGYTDLPKGVEGYMRTGWELPEYLEEKGWIKETDFEQLMDYPGSIIFQGARTETRENDGVVTIENIPSHNFILVYYDKDANDGMGMGESYDAGQTDYIQHETPVQFQINDYQGRGYDILNQLQWEATETGYYTFYAPWPYNNVMPYTANPFNNDNTVKDDYFRYQGYTIQDDAGNIFQHFECTEGVVSQWFSKYNYVSVSFRLRALSQAVSAEFYNTATTLTVPTTAVDRETGVFLTFDRKSETADCKLRTDDFSIEPQYRGLWIIDLLLNFASPSSNTGILTVAAYEGNYNPDGTTEAERWADCALIGIAHAPATDVSPTINLTLLETIAPNDHPIFFVVWSGGMASPVTIRTSRYNTVAKFTRLR